MSDELKTTVREIIKNAITDYVNIPGTPLTTVLDNSIEGIAQAIESEGCILPGTAAHGIIQLAYGAWSLHDWAAIVRSV